MKKSFGRYEFFLLRFYLYSSNFWIFYLYLLQKTNDVSTFKNPSLKAITLRMSLPRTVKLNIWQYVFKQYKIIGTRKILKTLKNHWEKLSLRLKVRISKITRTPKKVGVRTYATYANCRTLTRYMNLSGSDKLLTMTPHITVASADSAN